MRETGNSPGVVSLYLGMKRSLSIRSFPTGDKLRHLFKSSAMPTFHDTVRQTEVGLYASHPCVRLHLGEEQFPGLRKAARMAPSI
jgi:hypothetical protein